ncbi:DUF4132 domain-containing protein [Longimicrobium terrae]|uniref:DUF4132 domain-containing protein n=1 Tax=Longimicrobium terrae TaxID=1639882 RepID=A0A841GKG6_9BACT|nr:DUF4132 domain-containing protein [Longimicrobium terrae]MBB4634023.1 hypothetical protein [Longimicrobium terrae]MBB6069087.1 hypothetical protein [Longimicrobium terrae]NNC28262.1 DUF4132 domain-containing protein [Longimicrobium terrae]
MDPKEIQSELARQRAPGAVMKRLKSSRGIMASVTGRALPAGVGALVEEAFGQEDVHKRYHFLNEHVERIGPAFMELDDAGRRRLMEALLPGKVAAAEAAWDLLALRPFQTGMSRLPFRSRHSPPTLARVRGRWLLQTAMLLGEYDGDIAWVAAWAPHLAQWWGADELGWLLAGGMQAGGAAGDEVFNILRASAACEHPVGQMGRHVVRAFLSSARPGAWEYVERLLLAAQRQEGLRQVILEAVDESHPDAFRRMIRLVRDENLGRFSSVVRAMDTWFGFAWDGASGIKVDTVLDRVSTFLDDASARDAALGESDAETVYLALWSTAFLDVDAAVAHAARLMSSPSDEVRFAAVHLLGQSLWSASHPHLLAALRDPNLRVAARALDQFSGDASAYVDGAELFAALESLLARLPKRSQTVGALVWPWTARKLERTQVAAAMGANAANVPAERMLPYVRDMDPFQREHFICRIAGVRPRWSSGPAPERKKLTAEQRALVLELLGDTSADVRGAAFRAMGDGAPAADESARLIDLLARKPSDLRSGALRRLRALPDAELLDAAGRLTGDADPLRRLAGLELLRDAAEGGRAVDEVRERMRAYRASHDTVSEPEAAHLDAVLGASMEVPVLDDALGLVPGAESRVWPAPARHAVTVDTRAAQAAIESLAAVALAHQTVEVRAATGGDTWLLLERAYQMMPPRNPAAMPDAEEKLPLRDVWKAWLADRPANTRDADGMELFRALLAGDKAAAWSGPNARRLIGAAPWNSGRGFLTGVLEWCAWWQAPASAAAFLVDGVENAMADFTPADLREMAAEPEQARHVNVFRRSAEAGYEPRVNAATAWLARLRWWQSARPEEFSAASGASRIHGILRWFRHHTGGFLAMDVSLADFLAAYRAGAADRDDFITLILGRASGAGLPPLIHAVSSRKPPPELAAHAELLDAVEACRRRIVEVECARGDRPTEASRHALHLRWTGGLETLSPALPALGSTNFARTMGWTRDGASRQDTLSHLVLRSIPRAEDTHDAFAAWAAGTRLKPAKLVELALYAPQWAGHVAHTLGWPGLDSAVWWMGAHTKDDRSWSLNELKEVWAAEVSEYTPLSAADLTEGAVDVAWFREAHARLGAERWKTVEAAAKYGSSAGGHTRAQLFGRAMGGVVTREELAARIADKRHQDSVRAVGLVPLPADGERAAELLARYQLLQQYRRESRRFGSQRQASEGRAVEIGMANLARTAGYRDPQRLQWAMEREAVADLAAGPVVREVAGVTITLSIGEDGTPELSAARGGKALKSIPAAVGKDPEAAELKDRLKELRRQASRVRGALEEAMCRGDLFTGAELRVLLGHPILRPALERLVFVGDEAAGYPAQGGLALRGADGALHALGADESVRLAHPDDLFRRGDWSAWQRDCFRAERVQPFKQVFRELYPMVDAEADSTYSRRYAGHQVQPRQALALLGGRGWVAHPEEGVSRTFHDAGLTARLGFQEAFYTPADIEGLTLEVVVFTRKGEWKHVPLAEVPPRVFSEAMRDLDLVVSVAHQGGVDPEATASTVEMRAALLRETCELLGMDNVEVQGSHALIHGTRADYAVHLGSAGATVLPGTALFIVAVHSQHRGRMFLPFADDDPRTAEVMSKVLLLARDREIKDPHILDQIRLAAPSAPPAGGRESPT